MWIFYQDDEIETEPRQDLDYPQQLDDLLIVKLENVDKDFVKIEEGNKYDNDDDDDDGDINEAYDNTEEQKEQGFQKFNWEEWILTKICFELKISGVYKVATNLISFPTLPFF